MTIEQNIPKSLLTTNKITMKLRKIKKEIRKKNRYGIIIW